MVQMLSNNNFSFFFSQGLIIISSSWYSSLRRDKRVDHSEKKEGNEKNLRLNICNKDFTKSWTLIIIGVFMFKILCI